MQYLYFDLSNVLFEAAVNFQMHVLGLAILFGGFHLG